jgi:hypothetical protein
MNNFSAGIVKSQHSAGAVIIIFLLIGIISFGLLIPSMGFYWDDFPIAWIAETFGGEGLERYFSTNRPYWGLLFQLTTPILGNEPWHWQIFGLAWRILSAISFWFFLRQLWPNKSVVALFAGMAFLIYPGFTQQWISIIYSHFFIIMTAFIASLAFTVMSVRASYASGKSNKCYLYAALALCLSFLNLISLEYFFTLELIRILAIWIVIKEYTLERSHRLKKTFSFGLPYLLMFIGVAIWRIFYFPYQTNNYQLTFLQRIANEPLQALLALSQNLISSIWRVSVSAWTNVIRIHDFEAIGRITLFVSFALVLIAFLMFTTGFFIVGKRLKVLTYQDSMIDPNPSQPFWFSLVALLLAGWPVWLIDLSPALSFSLDRFTLPFMMGSAIFLVGLLEILPLNFTWKAIIFLSIISLSIGMHFRLANSYRRDWEVQRRFFWQLTWRIPGLKRGTTLLANELPVIHYSDNSLTAPLNWIYAPDNKTEDMAYLMVYPAQRLGSSLPELEKNLSIEVDYLAATFQGSTSQVVTVYYAPPACLRVLDNKLDALNHMLPLLMQHSAELSDQENILLEDTSAPPDLFYPEEEHGWCFYYEKAELARQQGDWDKVVNLGESAFALGDYPNDPAERLPFIEGYARTGDWNRALQQTEETLKVSSRMIPVLCLLWERIDQNTLQSMQKDEAIDQVSDLMDCGQ